MVGGPYISIHENIEGEPSCYTTMIRAPTLLLLCAILAGCLSETNLAELEATQPPISGSIPWHLHDCAMIAAIGPAPPGSLDAFTPEGLRIVTMTEVFELGLPVNPGPEQNFGVELLQCEDGSTLTGSAPMTYASYFAMAEVTGELDNRDAHLTFVKWDTMVPDKDRREYLQAAGLPVVDGDVEVSLFSPLPRGILASGGFNLGSDAITIDGYAGQPYEPGNSDFIEFQATDVGLATWYTTYNMQMFNGAVTIQSSPGSWAAEIYGAPVVAGGAFFASGDFVEGEISW